MKDPSTFLNEKNNIFDKAVSSSGIDPETSVWKPISVPWDNLIDKSRDVIKNGDFFRDEQEAAEASHWGPNCATFSRARERPIPGVKNPPPQLRSLDEPRGLPFLNQPSWRKTKERVDRDTYMADLAAKSCLRDHRRGKIFSLEHPGNSIALKLDSWIELMNEPGIFKIYHHHCMFHPCTKRKYQILITNNRDLEHKIGRICLDKRVCTRTGQPHEEFRHQIENGRVVRYGTEGSSEYPKELCDIQSASMLEAIRERRTPGTKYSFIEIFSGPNAPLTKSAEEYVKSKSVSKIA